ncbi:hypothetical protein ACROAE_16170 [Shewanella sp. MF05960]|uniref:hypothetical protein n=1 Tax=Shewanella sp. MF05960 TaxID=3434874 RepID=UPI003D7AE8A8
MNTIKVLQRLPLMFILGAMAIQSSSANEVDTNNITPAASPSKTTSSAAANNKPVVIQSQVTGSQEQPKVLYIMPWQGITNPIDINNKDMRLTLPQFKPINPKAFRQQVRDFANSSKNSKK